MNFLFVSACCDKALRRTRKVLDAYACRITPRTWYAQLSGEALDIVHSAMRAQASKTSAVACHRLPSHAAPELCWIVGSRRRLTDGGLVPLHVHGAAEDIADAEKAPAWQTLSEQPRLTGPAAQLIWFMRACGLLHDIGKLNTELQARIKGLVAAVSGPDYRHEVLSAVWLREALKGDGHLSTEAWQRAVATQSQVPEKFPIAQAASPADLLLWLVATHHHLPPADQSGGRYVPKVGYWRHDERSSILKLQLTPAHHRLAGPLPDKVQREWPALHATMPDALPGAAYPALAVYGRMTFKLLDYLASRTRPNAPGTPLPPKAVVANRDQDLNTHLALQFDGAEAVLHRVLALSSEDLPALYPEDRRNIDAAVNVARYPQFRWQNEADDAIRLARPERGYRGFFGVVAAGTGAGKTRGCARIMSALAGEEGLRYAALLGLRSLTLQTGREYQEKLELKSYQVATLVGCRATRAMHSAYAGAAKQEGATEDLEQQPEEQVIGADDTALPEDLELLLSALTRPGKDLSADRRRLIAAPVVACTADYLASAANLAPRCSFMVPLLRLLTSDLVLDEVDNYGEQDLAALARLIWLAGVLGRRVLISSATISPLLAKTLYGAYRSGWESHAAMHGWPEETPLLAGIFSNTPAPGPDDAMNLVFDGGTEDAFAAAYERHCAKTVASLRGQQPRRRMAYITGLFEPNGQRRSVAEAYRQIGQAVLQLHGEHHILWQKDGEPEAARRLSAGLVRVVSVYDCVKLAAGIAAMPRPAGYEVRVVSYHAKQLLGTRGYIEEVLDKTLKRGHETGKPDPILDSPWVKPILADTTARNVILIVVATPVEEVGRDHDFDWAIAEPSSWRSLIQLAGRLLRHREKVVATPNLLVLETNFRHLRGWPTAFCRPGYERDDSELPSKRLPDLLPADCDAITAEPVLDTGYPGHFARIERECLRELHHNAQPLKDGAGIWHDGHAHKFPFRGEREDAKRIRLAEDLRSLRWSLEQEKGPPSESSAADIILIPDLPREQRLITDELPDIVQKVAEILKRQVTPEFLREFFSWDVEQTDKGSDVAEFAPHLGFCSQKPTETRR